MCLLFLRLLLPGTHDPPGCRHFAFRLDRQLAENIKEYHKEFVTGDSACFIVDDLWMAMFWKLSGFEVAGLREHVLRRGLEMVYNRTSNAKVAALMDLGGDSRRGRATIRAFDGLLARLLRGGAEGRLDRWGGDEAMRRLLALENEVKNAERQIVGIEAWL